LKKPIPQAAVPFGTTLLLGAVCDDVTLGLGGMARYKGNMMRIWLTTCFAAILALTSVTLALGQHAQMGAVQLVLCSDLGDTVITLDAKGNPAAPAHVCPDCVATIAAQDVPAGAALPLTPLSSRLWQAVPSEHANLSRSHPPTYARGPPVLM
jgi:hypothetical protein